MLQHEFEERVGFQVPEEEFNKINAMYLDAGQNIDKDVFCKDYVVNCSQISIFAR